MAVLKTSEVLGNFRIQNLIKENLYTETYRVVDKDENPYFLKLFNLKKLYPKLMNRRTNKVKEIEYCQNISNRNIVSYIEDGSIEREDGDYQYYVTNYFNGRLLADVISKEGRMPEDRAVKIFRGILNALQSLHTQKVCLCHNDLDTSNVIISDVEEGEPVIIDLGHLSERCSGSVWFDTSDLNPMYHANETMVGIFDEQSDIFSACMVLYNMLTASVPWSVDYSGEDDYREKMKVINAYRKRNILDVSNLEVSNVTKAVLYGGLQLKSINRFGSVSEILSILDRPNESTGEYSNDGEGLSGADNKGNDRNHAGVADPNPVNFEIKRCVGGNGFKDIAGMQELKDYLYKSVIFVLKDKEIAEKYRITPPNGMLLYGPPGCGKTYFSEKFAEETGFNFLLIRSSDVASSFVHGSQEKINKLFKTAEKNAPIVICFDEFDALVPDRSAPGSNYVSTEVNEFLSQMNNCSKRGIFIVATSNRPDKIDPAVLRTGRIDKMVYVPLPDFEARREMFRMYLDGRPIKNDIDYDNLAEKTEGYIASDIAFIVNDAAMTAAFAREEISNNLLNTTVENIQPSLRQGSLEIYQNIRENMEMKNRSNSARVVIKGL